MKKFLIAYSSRTGNTKKVAEALYSVAENRCVLAQSKDVGNLDEYPLVFVGYWVDKGRPDKDTQDFLRRLENKKIILFQTLGAEPFSDHALGCFANAGRYIHESCHVLGGISIRGAIDPNLIARFSKLPDGSPHAPNEERKNAGRRLPLILIRKIWKGLLTA